MASPGAVRRAGGVAVLVALLLFAALGPARWQVRTGLGWQFDHVAGYFAFTLMFSLAWPRPLLVGGALMAAAMLLEALQALTPDRLVTLLDSGANAVTQKQHRPLKAEALKHC
jgi:hypothetical protein